MARKPKNKPPQSNSFDPDDLAKVLEDIETLEAEKRSVMAEAAGRCSQISKRIANEVKTGVALGIPKSVIGAIRNQRKWERKLEENAASVPEDVIELFEEASGQFSIFAPEEGEEVADGETAAQAAARRAKEAAAQHQQEEQADGARVLEEMAG